MAAGTARFRARIRPKAASSMRLAASRISAPSGVGRMPSTWRGTSRVPSVRSRSSILRRSALGESPMGWAAERMLPQRASSRNVRTDSQSGPPGNELKSMCSFSEPPRFKIIGIRCPCDLNNLFADRCPWQPEHPMTVHDRYTTRRARVLLSEPKQAKFRLGTSSATHISQRIVVFTATYEDIETLLPKARQAMGGGATNEVIHRVAQYNPDCFCGLARPQRYPAADPAAEGYLAFLILTAQGADLLMDGKFPATDPPLHLLARQNEKPAAVYCWGGYAPGAIAAGVPLAVEKVSTPLYPDAPILGRTITLGGIRIAENLGFRQCATFRGRTAPNICIFPRGESIKEMRPIYDDYLGIEDRTHVSITV